jgi:hypothetical protein
MVYKYKLALIYISVPKCYVRRLPENKKDVNPACLNFLKPFWLPPPPPPPELKRLPPPSFAVARGAELIAWPLVPCAGRLNLGYRNKIETKPLYLTGRFFKIFYLSNTA